MASCRKISQVVITCSRWSDRAHLYHIIPVRHSGRVSCCLLLIVLVIACPIDCWGPIAVVLLSLPVLPSATVTFDCVVSHILTRLVSYVGVRTDMPFA